MSLLRTFTSLVAAVALACSSVADNPATCLDDLGIASAPSSQDEHGMPRSSTPCAQQPCRTPTDLQTPPVAFAIVVGLVRPLSERIFELSSVESPAPPTPPPMRA